MPACEWQNQGLGYFFNCELGQHNFFMKAVPHPDNYYNCDTDVHRMLHITQSRDPNCKQHSLKELWDIFACLHVKEDGVND